MGRVWLRRIFLSIRLTKSDAGRREQEEIGILFGGYKSPRPIDVGEKEYRKGNLDSSDANALHVKGPFKTTGTFDIEPEERTESDNAYCEMI